KFYQSAKAPKIIKNGTQSDTLLNAFSGGLNAPQFSNIDWNGDGIQDLFIFDKESAKPLSFVYHNGKFNHVPKYEAGMPGYMKGWAQMRDHNFDGRSDLFTASFDYSTVSESPFILKPGIQLFVNKKTPGNNTSFHQYNNVIQDSGLYVPEPWNITNPPEIIPAEPGAFPAIDDIDGDGDLDVLSNASPPSISNLLYENLKKNKWNIPYKDDTSIYILRDNCWGFIEFMYGFYYKIGNSRNSPSFCDFQTWGKRSMKHADQSILMIDLDGDGIKDVVMGDFEYKSLVALYNGRLQNSVKADSIVAQDTLFLSATNTRKHFIDYAASYYVDMNGDNKKELVISTNANPVKESMNNIWIYNVERINSRLQFTETPGNDFLYQDMLDLGSRSVPAFTDIDNDGDKDLVIAASGPYQQTGNNHDKLFLYLNITDSVAPVFKLADSNLGKISDSAQFFAAHPTFGDLDGDGKEDMLIGESQGNIAYYRNTSSGTTYSFNLVNRNAFGILEIGYAAPQLVDLDRDGLLDIVCGNTRGTINFYKNTGSKTVPAFSGTATIDSLGKITTCETFTTLGRPPQTEPTGFSSPHVVDLNNDGIYELVSGSLNGRVYIYTDIYAHKDSIPRLINNNIVDYGKDNDSAYNKRLGKYNKIATAYLDGDQLPDLVIGNVSGGLSFLGSFIYKDTLIGLNENMLNDKSAVSLFPNPAHARVNIQLNRASKTAVAYLVYDLTGKKIMEGKFDRDQTNASITLSGLRTGLYFVKFEASGWYSTQSLMISE
ncbi:MAG: T9SS type A sorting domain-containing protein, partial [Bacteroidota bacterium]